MRVAIIALILSIIALSASGFATFTSLNDDGSLETAPIAAESGWSTAECQRADNSLDTLEIGCFQGNCAPYNDMLQAINDNCP